jgi:hypothetical protein
MSKDEAFIERAIVAKNKTAARITPQMLDDEIVDIDYHVFYGVLTLCVIRMKNGFLVTG